MSESTTAKTQKRLSPSDLKRDWASLQEDKSNQLAQAMAAGSAMFKDRLDAVRFTAISLQYGLWNSMRQTQQIQQQFNEAVKLGTEMMNDRDNLIDAIEEYLEGRQSFFGGRLLRKTALKRMKKIIADIREREAEEASNEQSQGAGDTAGGPQLESVSVERVGEAVPDEAVVDTPEGEVDQADLSVSGPSLQESDPDVPRVG